MATTAQDGAAGRVDPGRHGARRLARRRLLALVGAAGVLQAFVIVLILHGRHDDGVGHAREVAYVDPVAHWLRDSVMYTPVGVALLLLATVLARRLVRRWGGGDEGFRAAMVWALLGAGAYALASVPATVVHGALFSAGHAGTPGFFPAAEEGIVTLRYSFALLLVFAMVLGVPWSPRRRVRRS